MKDDLLSPAEVAEKRAKLDTYLTWVPGPEEWHIINLGEYDRMLDTLVALFRERDGARKKRPARRRDGV